MTAAAATRLCCLCGESLTELDVSGYDDFDDAHAASLARACGGLLKLRLNETEGLADAGVIGTKAQTSAPGKDSPTRESD